MITRGKSPIFTFFFMLKQLENNSLHLRNQQSIKFFLLINHWLRLVLSFAL